MPNIAPEPEAHEVTHLPGLPRDLNALQLLSSSLEDYHTRKNFFLGMQTGLDCKYYTKK
jgi:hypothetical protein